MWPLFVFHGKFAGWPILVACCGDIPEQQDSAIAPYRATIYIYILQVCGYTFLLHLYFGEGRNKPCTLRIFFGVSACVGNTFLGTLMVDLRARTLWVS